MYIAYECIEYALHDNYKCPINFLTYKFARYVTKSTVCQALSAHKDFSSLICHKLHHKIFIPNAGFKG